MDQLEYYYLLEKANSNKDSLQRMGLVMAFIVSSLSQNVDRFRLPFKSIVGETYEYHDDYINFIGECVEPDLLAFYLTNVNNDF